MGRIYAIALNAYREAIRDRVLFGVIGLAAASLIFGSSIAWLSLAEQVRILVDHGIVTISWLSNLVAVFLGASFLYKEIELRTLYVILAKPVARWQFVLGKYLGILASAVVFIAVTASMLLVLLNLQAAEAAGPSGTTLGWISRQALASRRVRLLVTLAVVVACGVALRSVRRVAWLQRARESLGAAMTIVLTLGLLAIAAGIARTVAPEETRYVLVSCVLVLGEVAITAAVAVMFSAFSTPIVTGVLTLGTFLVGRSAGAMLEIKGRQLPVEAREMLVAVSTVVPNLQLFVPSRDALEVREEGLSVTRYVLDVSAYSVLYAAILVLIATLLFRRRDLV